MIRTTFVLLAIVTTSAQATPLTEAARELAECRALSSPAARLACYDATVDALASALEPAATEQAAGPVDDPETRSGSVATAATGNADGEEERRAEPSSGARGESDEAGEEARPAWAAAPEKDERSREDSDNRFTDTIVRITRNNVGRHYFHTEDGAVWMQTQIEDIRPPRSLPAEATFRRKLTGNPTIQFDVSNRSYRVRRIE
jgi:hypothetical protein